MSRRFLFIKRCMNLHTRHFFQMRKLRALGPSAPAIGRQMIARERQTIAVNGDTKENDEPISKRSATSRIKDMLGWH